MIVGILGLGLIGGSLARAYALEGHTVYACEKDEDMLSFAMLAGAVHGTLTPETIPFCDLILLAIYPADSGLWLEEHAAEIPPTALVMDLCGTKRQICSRCFSLAEKYGFTFVGGHPMAGSQFSVNSACQNGKGEHLPIPVGSIDCVAFQCVGSCQGTADQSQT